LSNWFVERLHKGSGQKLLIENLVYQGKTAFQDVVIFDNPGFGRVLALDDVFQTSTRDEFVYHEMLAHVPMLSHGNVKSVLIIGGADGGMLEEVLKHPVDNVTMVDIDGELIELAKLHLREICGDAFEDPRATVLVDDGIQFVSDCTEGFDLIIVDSTDPQGPGEVLFSREFYEHCRRILNDGGLVVTQNGVPFHQPAEIINTRSRWQGLFDASGFYLAAVPGYVGGFMALGWGGASIDLTAINLDQIASRFESLDLKTEYYTPEIHRAAFALPPYVQSLMD
jgi:spermidine synthase